jgi:hypothetical protein
MQTGCHRLARRPRAHDIDEPRHVEFSDVQFFDRVRSARAAWKGPDTAPIDLSEKRSLSGKGLRRLALVPITHVRRVLSGSDGGDRQMVAILAAVLTARR